MLHAVFVGGDDGFVVAYIEELPGAHAQGRSLDEARRGLDQAVALVLVANRRTNATTFSASKVLLRESYPS